MSTLTIPLADVRTGDKVIAITGLPTPAPIPVIGAPAPRPNGVVTVALEPTLAGSARSLYGDQHPDVTVERTPAPERKPERKITRNGLALVGTAGDWRTEDGRFRLYLDDSFLTTCEEPHPARISARWREHLQHEVRDYPTPTRERYGHEFVVAIQEGKAGYWCTGDRSHYHAEWCVWDTVRDDYLHQVGGYGTLGEAAADVAEWYEDATGG